MPATPSDHQAHVPEQAGTPGDIEPSDLGSSGKARLLGTRINRSRITLPRPGRAAHARHRPPSLGPTARWLLAAGALFSGQLIWLLIVSVHIFGRFSLTSDYALFFQAWHQVAHGQLDPTTTIYRTGPFLTNHFELFLYPLALFQFLDPSGLVLLVLQDLAMVTAEMVAFLWILELANSFWRGRSSSRNLVIAGALVMLTFDPWIWWANAFDFHLEIFATLFALLAARSIWNRRWLAAGIWTLLTLCCGTVESVILIGLGIGLIISQRKLWRQGLALVASAVAWLLALNALGYDKGSQLSTTYGYLTGAAPGANVHITQVIFGALRHPHLVAQVVKPKLTDLWHIVAGSGFVGMASSLGLPVTAALLIPAALNAQLSLVEPEASFQVLPVLLLVPIGSVLFFCWCSRRDRPWRLLGVVLGFAAVVQVIAFSIVWIPRSTPYFVRTDARAASVLSSVLARTPSKAEVIASNGFIGRFAGRPWVYALEKPTTASGSVPVRSSIVEFVLSSAQGLETTPPAGADAAINKVRHTLHATEIVHSAGISVFVWHPPAGVREVSLPGL